MMKISGKDDHKNTCVRLLRQKGLTADSPHAAFYVLNMCSLHSIDWSPLQQKYSAKLIGQNFENCSSSTNQVSLDGGAHDTAAAALL